MELKDKVAFVTGGSKGIGYGIAKSLAKEGVKVAITSRSLESAGEAAIKLNKEIGQDLALGVKADVRHYDDLTKAVEQTIDKFGQLDFVIANAGLGHYANIQDLTPEQWSETIDTNLTGVFNTAKTTLDALKKTKGYFISISSLAGTNFFANGSAYNASKFGVTGFTQALMLDVRDLGVKVSTIMPGSVASHFNGNNPGPKDDWKIQPEDIGEMTVDLFKMNPRTLPSKVEMRPSQPSKK
ncbi:SDR family oxidoreductase [Psychroflexus halocasei]|uniref:NADP-dependent 3-hydroxy acid dehydrogenase YdfG n=1 Tax=Psychroflexus halocasei TaxID=908615 RepID=A0A1H3ZFB5_9FLAO|nr:SDR family oxidoreductase [Psychroflexus halocasei]SEA22275.1 NADP-dependent 3-hydroxy acid dehydrogenase YdfG [Psychroflexus halocasei]